MRSLDLKLTAFWERWDLIEIIKQAIPVCVPRQTELHLHFLEDPVALASGNEMAKHVLNSKMFSPVFCTNQGNVRDALLQERIWRP